MLADLLIKNFKSIDMPSPITLKEFSILCGSNSSGKSSLIQTILMLSQSFSSRYQDEPIILNGPLIRLGSLKDIKRHFSVEEEISLSFSISLNSKQYYTVGHKKIRCELVLGKRKEKQRNKDEEEYHPLILRNKIVVSTMNKEGVYIDTDQVEIIKNSNNQNEQHEYSVSLFDITEKAQISADFPDYKILSVSKGDLVPTTFLIEYDFIKKISSHVINSLTKGQEANARRIESNFLTDGVLLPRCFFEEIIKIIDIERKSLYDSISVPKRLFNEAKYAELFVDENHFITTLKDNLVDSTFPLNKSDIKHLLVHENGLELNMWENVISSLEEKKRKTLIELIDKYRIELQNVWYNAMPRQIEQAFYNSIVLIEVENALSFYFARSVKYLGPLRNEPQAIYSSLGHIDPNTVGLKGEFTAAVLHKNKDKFITYSSPSLVEGKLVTVRKTRPLNIACQEWLSYLGVIQHVKTHDRGKLGYELSVKTDRSEEWQDLTHVGVGVSQVLPIVLMFLLSEEDDILIFEQPELHLHPKVQSRLSDLFLTMSDTKRQCIIETHSEYLINRLRLRIAQDNTTKTMDTTSLYFISKENGFSNFKNIDINKYGSIKEWPKDFFDQTDREVENILYEASVKRKMEKSAGEK